MPTLQRRPRRAVEEDDEDEENYQQQRPRQRRRRDDSDEEGGGQSHGSGDEDGPAADESTETQLVKKLVRYALACEYSRTPIRRDGIREKGTVGVRYLEGLQIYGS